MSRLQNGGLSAALLPGMARQLTRFQPTQIVQDSGGEQGLDGGHHSHTYAD